MLPVRCAGGTAGSLSQPPGTRTRRREASWQCWRPKASLPRGWSKVEGIEQDAGLSLVSPDGGRGGQGTAGLWELLSPRIHLALQYF